MVAAGSVEQLRDAGYDVASSFLGWHEFLEAVDLDDPDEIDRVVETWEPCAPGDGWKLHAKQASDFGLEAVWVRRRNLTH